jgi:pimeloyl-ACP methyl ester carboxylesterase
VIIPKTGHMLPVTQPKLCNKFIEDVMSATDAH